MGSTGCYKCHGYPNEYHNEYMITLQSKNGRNYQLCGTCITAELEKIDELKNITSSFFSGNTNRGNFYSEITKILEIKYD